MVRGGKRRDWRILGLAKGGGKGSVGSCADRCTFVRRGVWEPVSSEEEEEEKDSTMANRDIIICQFHAHFVS